MNDEFVEILQRAILCIKSEIIPWITPLTNWNENILFKDFEKVDVVGIWSIIEIL